MNTPPTGSAIYKARKLSGMRGNAAATAIICLIVAGLAGTLLTKFLSPVQVSVSDAALVAEADYLAESYLAMLRQKIRHAGGEEAVIAYFHNRPVIMPINNEPDCVVNYVVTGRFFDSDEHKGEFPQFVQDNDDNFKLTLSIALPYTDAKGIFTEVHADRVLYIKKDYILEDNDTYSNRSSFAKMKAYDQFQYILEKNGGTPSEISCFDYDGKDQTIFQNTSGKQDMYWSLIKNGNNWEYRSAYIPDLSAFPKGDTVCVNVLTLTDETSTTRKVTWTGESKLYKDLPSVPAN